MTDNVNPPAPYTDGKIEVIDYIEDKHFGYHLGNAIKYISRAGKKTQRKPKKTYEKRCGIYTDIFMRCYRKETTVKIKVTELECDAYELRQSNSLADSIANLLRGCFSPMNSAEVEEDGNVDTD